MTAPSPQPPPAPEQATRRGRKKGNAAPAAGEELIAPEPPKLRRRPMLIAGSVLLTALGALLGAWLLTSLSGTKPYIAVRADIERGQVIKETDLVRTQLRADAAVKPLRWDQQQLVVGKYATVDMAEGSLVTSTSVASRILPEEGQNVVGLALVPGQAVTGELRVGQKVRVVIVPASAESTSSKPPVYQGEVTDSRMSDDGTTKLVDVQVSAEVAPTIASAAARQEVSLLVDTTAAEGSGGDGGSAEPTTEPTPESSPSS